MVFVRGKGKVSFHMVKKVFIYMIKICKNKRWNTNIYVYIGVGIITVILAFLFYRNHNTEIGEIKNMASSILQFSAIFSAILISYIISKTFQIKQERLGIKQEIVNLSKKATYFRRIANILYCNSYFLFKDQNYEKSILYNDIKAIIDYDNPLHLYGDNDDEVNYSLDILKEWNRNSVGNNLWYCLVNKWSIYKDDYDFDKIAEDEQERILFFCRKIDDFKYSRREFDRNLLGDIGSDFALFLCPKLLDKTIRDSNNKLPNSLIFLLFGLFLICIFGIIIPLVLISLSLGLIISLILSSVAIIILLSYFFFFIFSFYNILKNEIN